VTQRPIYWQDVDLKAWHPLRYSPLLRSDFSPRSINDPTHPLDLNNLAYNVAALGEKSVFRLLDDVISPLAGSRRYVTRTIETAERHFRRQPDEWISEGSRVADLPHLTVTDYSFTSQGNLQRVDRAVDWMQDRTAELNGRLVAPLSPDPQPLPGPINRTVDAAQLTFWETYRFGQRTAMQTLDEGLLNGIENGTDRMLNVLRRIPAEVVVE
jgi:hypothetical protein